MPPFDLLTFLLLALAATRLTRLLTLDTILDPLRLHLMRWQFTDDLISCPWCTGFWVALAYTATHLLWSHAPLYQFATLALAVSQVIGLVHSFDDAIHSRPDFNFTINPPDRVFTLSTPNTTPSNTVPSEEK